MYIVDRFRTYQTEIQQSGIVAAFFNFFQGRCTFFAIAFSVVGCILALRGKLDGNYALFVTAIQGILVAHSCKEDWHTQRMAALQQNDNNTTVDVNVQPAVVAVTAPVAPVTAPGLTGSNA